MVLLMVDGHHRLKALENLDQEIIPVRIFSLEEGIERFGAHGLGVLVEVSKLSGNYKGAFKVDVIDKFGVEIEARSFMREFPLARTCSPCKNTNKIIVLF